MGNGNNERDRLNELFEELENVRAGRKLRRRAGAVVAVLALAGVVVTVSLMGSAPNAPKPTTMADKPDDDAPIVDPVPVDQPADGTPAPRYASVEIVRSGKTSSRIETVRTSSELRHVEIIDDEGLAKALRELDEPGGIARVNGRVILMGSLAKAEKDETPRSPGAM